MPRRGLQCKTLPVAKKDDANPHRRSEDQLVERVPKALYEAELFRLQAELVKLQEWVRLEGKRVVIVFEGRDAAGKGSAIKRVTQYLNPRVASIVALPTPTDREQTQWYFQRYVEQLPAAGEIRCSTGPGTTGPASSASWGSARRTSTGASCSRRRSSSGCWSRTGSSCASTGSRVSDAEQERRFQSRLHDPMRQWKLSPMDLESRHPLGGLLAGQGRDVRAHRHPGTPWSWSRRTTSGAPVST